MEIGLLLFMGDFHHLRNFDAYSIVHCNQTYMHNESKRIGIIPLFRCFSFC